MSVWGRPAATGTAETSTALPVTMTSTKRAERRNTSESSNDVEDVILAVTASNKDDIIEECERFARIVVNGKNRIEEAIATFGVQELFYDPEMVRQRISEAVARVLDERSGNKLDKYFRCVEKLSG